MAAWACVRKYVLVTGFIFFLLIVFLQASFIGTSSGEAKESLGWIYLEGEIDPGTVVFVKRALQEARQMGVAALVLELDTPGGYLDSTEKIQRLLVSQDVPVYAFINQRALSAGSFLALSTDGFFMAPGSTIGAAEPRYMGGSSVADPKFLSAWEARMRGAAERQGKDPLLAAAMVNKELEVEGVVEKGELLTLTSGEAERLAFVDGIVSDKDELCSLIGMPAARIISFTPSAAERITGFVTNPAVATLLLALGITAMVIEILTAGFGVAGLLSILCFSLYFGGHFMAGIAGWEAILLFLLGLALLLVEGFIPGFGIFGLGGLLALAASIVLAAVTAAQGVKMLLLSLLLSAVLIFFAFRFLQKKGLLRKFILQEAAKKELGYVATANREELVGLQGKTITPLRPAGKALIGGEQVDVVSEGGFIPANSKIYVQKVEGMRVVVRSQEESN